MMNLLNLFNVEVHILKQRRRLHKISRVKGLL